MRKENRERKEKKEKKADKFSIFTKIVAAFLVAFTVIGTCYTFIYLVING